MEQLEASKATFNILTHSQFQLPDEAADTYWLLQRWPLALQDELDAAAERIRGYRGDFQQQLHEDQQQLQADLQELQVKGLSAQQLVQLCVHLCLVRMWMCRCRTWAAAPAALAVKSASTGGHHSKTTTSMCLQPRQQLQAAKPFFGRRTSMSCAAARTELLQVAISKVTRVGGLQAVEERSIAVQDFESKLEELDRLAETYRVGWTGPTQCCCQHIYKGHIVELC
jgi:hypothetical protein